MSTAHGDPDGSCVFCEIVAGRASSDRVAEDEKTLAFMDIDPGSEGHLLVIPKRHSRDLLDVPDDDLIATTLTARRVAQAMQAGLGAEGVNLLNCCGEAAWQTMFHFHIHVIPRYQDVSKDRMQLPYEPGMPSDPRTRARCAGLLAASLQASE